MLASIGIEDPARYMGPPCEPPWTMRSPAVRVLTGSVASGDAGTVKVHLQALE